MGFYEKMRKSISSDIYLNIFRSLIRLIPSNYITSIFQLLFGISSQALSSTPGILRVLINFYMFYKSISFSHEPKLSVRVIICFLLKQYFIFNFLWLFSLSEASEVPLFLYIFVAQIDLHRISFSMWFCFK